MLPAQSFVEDNSCWHSINMWRLGELPVKANSFVVCTMLFWGISRSSPLMAIWTLPFTDHPPNGQLSKLEDEFLGRHHIALWGGVGEEIRGEEILILLPVLWQIPPLTDLGPIFFSLTHPVTHPDIQLAFIRCQLVFKGLGQMMWAFHVAAFCVWGIIVVSAASTWCNEEENPVVALIEMEIIMFVLLTPWIYFESHLR